MVSFQLVDHLTLVRGLDCDMKVARCCLEVRVVLRVAWSMVVGVDWGMVGVDWSMAGVRWVIPEGLGYAMVVLLGQGFVVVVVRL